MGKSWDNHGCWEKNDLYIADTFDETGCMKSGIPLCVPLTLDRWAFGKDAGPHSEKNDTS